MRVTRKVRVSAAMSAIAVLTLGACGAPAEGSSPETELHAVWRLTDRGDVKCVMDDWSGIPECDWSTLVDAGTHTTAESEVLQGDWIFMDGGQVYCLTTDVIRVGVVLDCDYDSYRQKPK